MTFSLLRLRNSESGATLVETALVIPIFLVLMFGVIDLGRYFWAQHSVTYAANEAARMAVLADVTDSEVEDVATFHMRNWQQPHTTQVTETPAAAGAPATVTVTVSMPFSFILLPEWTGRFAVRTISHTVTMRSEK
ncbi:TadE/TadG family type IV pilus assembly protein [Oleidesulfovibrio sp.]|uniref:TadE/TadG family type IV pilus assembly protein n=1 Tax=Oleidesulfovibrio sp. TaxID=2909707 RepID=UPI003A8B35CF